MRPRILVFTLLLTVVQAVSAGRPGSSNTNFAKSEVVTRCEAPVEFSDRHQHVALGTTQETALHELLLLTLIRQPDNRYEVLAGADSVGTDGSLNSIQSRENPVHLVLDHGSGMEHFLFMLNPDGSGELLWSSATGSALTTCTTVWGTIKGQRQTCQKVGINLAAFGVIREVGQRTNR